MAGGGKGDSKASSKPAPHTNTTSPLFGSLPKATGFLRRGTPKTQSKTPSPVLARSGSDEGKLFPEGFQEGDEPGGRDAGLMGEEGLSDSGYGLSRSESGRTQSTHASTSPSPAADAMNMGRRGSAVSTSSLSQSPPSPHDPPSRVNRNSLSSFASSSGSPLATASSFSDRTTIGDLSTASMPLLTGAGGSSSYRQQTDSSSAASFSDASSVHSYPPPPPRPRTTTSSTKSTKSAKGSLLEGTGLEGWKNWAREMEAASAPPDRIRRKGSVGSDVPLDMWTSRVSSSSSSSLGRTHAPSQPSLISYALSSPSVNRSTLTASLNPLAPLRKRLARSLNSGRRAGVELQLLLELIDALEHYIRSADAHAPPSSQPPPTPSSASGSTSNSSISLSLEPSTPSPPSTSTPLPSTSQLTQPPRQTDVDLLSEIRSLVKELVECVPDAQLCLTTGLYGPLAFPSPSYSATTSHYGAPVRGGSFSSSWPTMPLSTTASMVHMDLRDSGAIEWWPRRLVRDCRGLLEEVGFVLTPREGTGGVGVERLGGGERSAGGEMGLSGNAGEGAANSSFEEALGVVRAGGGGVERPAVTLARRESKPSAARREELLVEGKKRWDAYRRRQAALPDAYNSGEASPILE